jgi:hypothetical protein
MCVCVCVCVRARARVYVYVCVCVCSAGCKRRAFFGNETIRLCAKHSELMRGEEGADLHGRVNHAMIPWPKVTTKHKCWHGCAQVVNTGAPQCGLCTCQVLVIEHTRLLFLASSLPTTRSTFFAYAAHI